MKTLFLVLDTIRRDYLESYGNTWVKTPNLTRLASRSVIFDNHWVGSLPCMPARREFMTGRYNFVYRAWGPLEPFDDVLPEGLRRNGVFTHLVTDHYHYFELGGENYHTAFNTWDFLRGNENDPWVSFVDALALPKTPGKLTQPNWHNRTRLQKEEDFSGPRTAMSACEWLETNKNAKGDWFLQVEIFDPHEPFHCTEKYREMYGDKWDGPLFDWPDYRAVAESPEAVGHIRKCYAGLMTMTDYWVGKVLDKLEELGLFDDTLIIFTTDHGTMLAEHGYWMKNYMPVYNEITRIPLVIKPPGKKENGRHVGAFTQTIDIMPTILDFFGVAAPPHVHGRSIRPALEGGTVREDGIFGYFGKATNVTDGRYVYMRNPVNADGGPLHTYTAMPGGFRQWVSRDLNEKMEMGRYFGHTYNMPVYKIPSIGELPRPLEGGESYQARHQLFDVLNDPQQNAPLDNEKLEKHFCDRIIHYLKLCEAPPEQFARLGL